MKLVIKIRGFEIRTITSVESVQVWPDDLADPDKSTFTIGPAPLIGGGEILFISEKENNE